MPRAALRVARPTGAGHLGAQNRRWASYDGASLTNRSLADEVAGGLGPSSNNVPRINEDLHTVETAIGQLPMSPVFDPAWVKARRRQRKASPTKPVGRFRQKLANNPFARALETPIRRCPNTAASLPRYFLQDFELVTHPEAGTAWWAPGPLSFGNAGHEISEAIASPGNEAATRGTESSPTERKSADATRSSTPPFEAPATPARPRGPLTSYTLCRKSVIDSLGGKNKKNASVLLAVRSGMAVAPDTRNPVWREDMGDVLLRMLRRRATDALVTWASSTMTPKDGFETLRPCSGWAEVDMAKPGGCVLWLPGVKQNSRGAAPYATLDIAGAQYKQKLVVHNLPWLLGESEVERLKSESPTFCNHQILVLRHGKCQRLTELHLLLWRVQGYLASPREVLEAWGS